LSVVDANAWDCGDGYFSECSTVLLELYDSTSQQFEKLGQALWALTTLVDHCTSAVNNLNDHVHEIECMLDATLAIQKKFMESDGKRPAARKAVAELTKIAFAHAKDKKRIERNGGRNSGNILLDLAAKIKSFFARNNN
jgi:hypothetical protein